MGQQDAAARRGGAFTALPSTAWCRPPARRRGLLAGALLALGGCAGPGGSQPTVGAADALPASAAASAWQAPLPHQGRLGELARWWQQFDDPAAAPVLVPLIDAAQTASPTLSSARARIAQARASRVAAGAALLPSADASASAQRSSADRTAGLPAATNRLTVGADLAWEWDLFGGNAAARDAAQARLDGAQALWHDARVAVAAEVANQYNSLRACEAQVVQAQLDATSRGETARLTELSANAGLQAPADAALARAGAAQARAQLTQQRAACDALVKGLVALTAADEPALRTLLAAAPARLADVAGPPLPSVPAALLRQRPDLANAERELLAARGDIGQAQAARLPRIALGGSIGVARVDFGGGSPQLHDSTWTIGPVTVSLPLFDGGRRRADVDAALARRDDALSQYAARLRTAVREVEEALVTLDSTARRDTDLIAAADGYAVSLRATEARFRGGLGSLFDLEDVRRLAVAAQVALIDLRRERNAAWIGLYRALGGGWSADDLQTVGGIATPAPVGADGSTQQPIDRPLARADAPAAGSAAPTR